MKLTPLSPRLLGNYGESGMEAFKDMAAKEGICIAHSGKTLLKSSTRKENQNNKDKTVSVWYFLVS